MSVNDSEKTRLRALKNIQALIAQDIEREVRTMVAVGFSPDEALRSARVWWARMMRQAIKDATEALWDVL